MATKYFCDRCSQETTEEDIRIVHLSDKFGGITVLGELCRECVELLEDLMAELEAK